MGRNTTNPPAEELEAMENTEGANVPEAAEAAGAPEAAEATVSSPAEGSPEWYAQKVPIRLFKDGGKYKDDVFVAVNGRGYLIQRGVEVMVPRFVAQVLYQSMDQDAATAEYMEQESAQFQAETQRLGLN